MNQLAVTLSNYQSKVALLDSDERPDITNTYIRQQIKAHLKWCAYLGASVDEENMENLVNMLRETAANMHVLADQAEQLSST